MPELPEVEIVARSLDKIVKNRRIMSAELLRPRLAPETEPSKFAARLLNAKINFVHRRGKHVLFDLDNGRTLITHLRMSGKFLLLPHHAEDPKFTHAVFNFEDGERLGFQDQRHFGLMKIVETSELESAKEIKKLAPEPFSDAFSTEYLRTALRSTKRSLKEFLLDQTKICGLGNIYASEAMFLAKANPRTLSFKLSKPKITALFDSVRRVLSEAIDLGSTLDVDPSNIGGSIYGVADVSWRVYARENQPCLVCSAVIVRLKQAGRSTYYCPRCQR